MAVIEGGTPLACRKCGQPFPPVAQFCTSCGVARAIALGHELDPEEKALRLQAEIERKEAEAREAEKEQLRLENERREQNLIIREEKRQVRKEFLIRNKYRIRVASGLLLVVGIYSGFQTAIYAQTTPETVVADYVAAVVGRDPESLKNPDLFPVKFASYEIAPPDILEGINGRVVVPSAIKISWSSWSSEATAELGDWGFSINLVSEDVWNFGFRRHVWRVESNAPMLKVSSGTDISSYLDDVVLGSADQGPEFASASSHNPVKYVMWPGSFYVKSDGKGFIGNWSESVKLTPGTETKVQIQVGDYEVPSEALVGINTRVRNQFKNCFLRNGCGAYLSMDDFGIEYPWYWENYWIDDTYSLPNCVYSSEDVQSATSATIYYSCGGNVFREVTWLIAEYYFWPDEWDWDWGSANPDFTYKADLRYDEDSNQFIIARVSKV